MVFTDGAVSAQLTDGGKVTVSYSRPIGRGTNFDVLQYLGAQRPRSRDAEGGSYYNIKRVLQ